MASSSQPPLSRARDDEGAGAANVTASLQAAPPPVAGQPLVPLRFAQKYVRVGIIVYFVIVPVLASIAVSHIWAVNNSDVYFFLPYISDSGGDPPQSGVFGLGLTTASIAGIIVFALRYITVKDISRARNKPRFILMLNYFNLLAGIGIFFGLLLVAMNPTGHLRRDGTWLKPIFYPHLLGASLLFASGLSYMLVNAVITLFLMDQYGNESALRVRLAIFAVDLLACITTAVKFPQDLLSMKPHPTNPREYPQGTIISIVAEWFMLVSFMGYVYTMKSELDAMVVVIGIQKPRSLLNEADSPTSVTVASKLSEPNTAGKHRVIRQLPSSSNGPLPQAPRPNGASVGQGRPTESVNQPLANPTASNGNGKGMAGVESSVPSQLKIEGGTMEPSGPPAPVVGRHSVKKTPVSRGVSGQSLSSSARSSLFPLATVSDSSGAGSQPKNRCTMSPGKAIMEVSPSASWSSGSPGPLKSSPPEDARAADWKRKKRRSRSSSSHSTSLRKTPASSQRSTSSRSTSGRRSRRSRLSTPPGGRSLSP